MSNSRRLRRTTLAIGLPGRAPSAQARALAATPHVADLPAGCWHTSANMAPLLAGTTPVLTNAVHAGTGARFRLLSAPDGPILSVCAEDEQARQLIVAHWDDPSAWANAQRWRIAPEPGGRLA